MNLRDAFVQSIAESLYDDTPRLIYADWLDDNGDPERAEFIRVQCELEPLRDRYEIDRATQLHRREDELLLLHHEQWLGPAFQDACYPYSWRQDGLSIQFRRGFVDTVLLPVRTFLSLGMTLRHLYPAIRRVVLFRVNGYGERLAASEALIGLTELELACWYSDDDAKAIAASRRLGQLQVLELWLGRAEDATDEQLCRTMAASTAWPRLRELALLNPDGKKSTTRKRLRALIDETAGRTVAVYRRGYPDVFPFAADSRYAYCGYLPDGRAVMVQENSRTSPPTLMVITFNRRGIQNPDSTTVVLPEELSGDAIDYWEERPRRIKKLLTDTIGYRPGFIRIRSCQFPDDPHGDFYPTRGHYDFWRQLGYADTDDEASWQEEVRGNGGRVWWLVREGQYTIGGDWWADKTGQVHST